MDQPQSSIPLDTRYEEAAKAVQNFNKAMQDTMGALTRWYEDVWVPICNQVVEAVNLLTVRLRRGILYSRLLDRHFPVWLAKLIAIHYPERYLPYSIDQVELVIGIVASSKLFEKKGK